MSRRSDTSLAAVLLTNRLAEGEHAPLKSSEFWSLIQAVEDPACLLGLTAVEIQGLTGGTLGEAERITGLLEGATRLAFELDRQSQSGLELVSPFDDAYPARLKQRLTTLAPPLLYAVGNTSLLAEPGVGVVGSRNVTEALAEIAAEAAAVAVRNRLPVVSGAARGIDQAAMNAAFQAGGAVVGVLAESLEKQANRPDVRHAISEDQLCLLTPYKPDAPFSAGNAMGRNKLIYALARVTLVVTSDLDNGGTWAGATEAIRRGFGPVAIWGGPGVGMGNAALVKRGATEISTMDNLLEVEMATPALATPTEGLLPITDLPPDLGPRKKSRKRK